MKEECVPVNEEVRWHLSNFDWSLIGQIFSHCLYTFQICDTTESMKCTEKSEDDCQDCREVLEDIDVPCDVEEEVCEETTKPVCSMNRKKMNNV